MIPLMLFLYPLFQVVIALFTSFQRVSGQSVDRNHARSYRT